MIEHELFKKARSINPDLTEEQFIAKREEALARANAGDHVLTEAGGILMEEIPNNEELKELTEDERHLGTGN